MKELQQQIAELVGSSRVLLFHYQCQVGGHIDNENPDALAQAVVDRMRRALEPFNTQPKA